MHKDRLFAWLFRASALLSGSILGLIVLFVFAGSVPALVHVGVLDWLTDPGWYPAAAATEGQFNLLPMLAGTLAVATGAVLLSAPTAFLVTSFLHFYAAAWQARWIRRLIELLAGVPSVVFGLWGLVSLVPLIAHWEQPGSSLFAGMIVLGLMIFPTATVLFDAAFAETPREFRLAAAGLGLSNSATVLRVYLPACRADLAGATAFALARAVGETIAVLMVCGNVVQYPGSLFDPVRPLTATIALEMGYARGDHRSALFVCGLLLLTGVCVMSLLAVSTGPPQPRGDVAKP